MNSNSTETHTTAVMYHYEGFSHIPGGVSPGFRAVDSRQSLRAGTVIIGKLIKENPHRDTQSCTGNS